MLHTVQPQDLGVAVGKGALAGAVGSAVVAAALGLAGAAADCADVLGLDDDLHRLHAVFKVAAHGGEDDHEHGLMDAVEAQLGIGAEQEGTDVQGGAGLRGDEPLVQLYQSLDSLQSILGGHHRQAETDGGVLHTLHVVPGTEQLDLAVLAAVSLQALKDLGTVVEHAGGGGQGDVLEGDDAGIVPALFIGIVHDEHVVGVVDAEAQLVGGGQFDGMGGFRDADIHGIFLLLLPCGG